MTRRRSRHLPPGRLVLALVGLCWALSGCHDDPPKVTADRLPCLIERLWTRPNPAVRARAARMLAHRPVPGRVSLLGDRVVALGLTDGYWTAGGKPAAVVVRNLTDRPLRQRLYLECHAEEADLPITAFVDDGERRHRRVFGRPGRATVTLGPVPPHEQRLYLVHTDRTWVPGNRDPRPLGVRVTVPPPEEVLTPGPHQDALARMLAERPFVGKTRLLGHRLVAFGLTRNGWTSDESDAGVVAHNPTSRPWTVGLDLACHARPDQLPLQATVTCGEVSRSVRFSAPGNRTVELPVVAAGAVRVCGLRTDRTWSHGPGMLPRGVRPTVEIAGQLRHLDRAPDPVLRSHLAHRIAGSDGDAARLLHLDGDRVVAAGLSVDRWTHGQGRAALVITNRGDRPLTTRLTLACDAPPSSLPLTALLQSGAGDRTTVRFDHPRPRTVTLPAVPPHQRRLVLLSTDHLWRPRRGDDRRDLGVRIADQKTAVAGP